MILERSARATEKKEKKNVKSISLERIQWLNRFACYGVIEWETASLNLIIYLLHNNRKLMDGVRKWGGAMCKREMNGLSEKEERR